MKIFTSLDDIRIDEKTSVALGNFDGIHIGHAEVFKQALNTAKEEGLKSLCYTFSNHPFNFIMRRDESEPEALKLIMSEEDKIARIEDYGFDYLVNVPFDETTMKMSADTFFNDIILSKLNAQAVSVGFNYTYGARAMGTSATLIEECKSHGMIVSVHDAVMIGDRVVSSTMIREEIARGNMELVSELLGCDFSYSGIAVHGKTIGRENGVPTININIPINRAVPPYGVYAATIYIDEQAYDGIVNIGNQPTFGHNEMKLEAHLFDYDDNAYDKSVRVCLKKFIRPERKFESKDALYAQIKMDCEAVR